MVFDSTEIEAVIRAELVKQGGEEDHLSEDPELAAFNVYGQTWHYIDPGPIASAVLSWLRDQGAAS